MAENIQKSPEEQTRKKKILIVDDEPDMVYSLKLTIENAGYETTIANNGQEALKKVREEQPDLIVADVLMPVMDGFEFYKRLKQNKVTAFIPVIILTARGHMEDAFKVVGVDDFFAKPFENDILLSKIKRLLSKGDYLQDESEVVRGPKKVLVAGVYNEVVENMAKQLKEHDCEVNSVLSGPEVITQSAIFEPYVIILDIQMTGLDSSEIVRILRLLPKFKEMPILLYSCYRVAEMGGERSAFRVTKRLEDMESYKEDCLDAGATEYFGQFHEATFFNTVQPYL